MMHKTLELSAQTETEIWKMRVKELERRLKSIHSLVDHVYNPDMMPKQQEERQALIPVVAQIKNLSTVHGDH
jgi:hypothetical protein